MDRTVFSLGLRRQDLRQALYAAREAAEDLGEHALADRIQRIIDGED